MVKPHCFIILAAIFLLSRICKICSTTTTFPNSTIDQDALLEFKASITSDPHQILHKNWSNDAPVCSWIGVSCSANDHRVTALNVSGFSLAGPISPYLGNLTFLNLLALTSNNFTGLIPQELSNLHHLTVLDFGFNQLNGEIPSWLGTLSELESVRLNRNAFSGNIPRSLGNITKLRILNLAYNVLGGVIPLEIANLSSLERLDLKYNGQITDQIPDGTFFLPRIERIDLTGNSLSGRLPNRMCENAPQLSGLYLSANLLSGEIPFGIHNCSALQDLSLSYNHLNGSIPSSIGLLANLRTLYLGINSFNGDGIPPHLHNLSRLEILSLTGASLTGRIPSQIFNMSSLEGLDLSNNTLSGGLPLALCDNTPQLQQLFLGSNQLNGRVSDKICNCRSLSLLSLSNNNFTDKIPNCLANLTLLNYLYLHSNTFTGEIPAELGSLNLVHLYLRYNALSGAIPVSIFNISSVEQMYLSFNLFTGQLPSTMGLSLPNLQEFLLSGSKVNGPIPSSITNASSLTTLDLSSNSFTGSVPNFGDLRRLQRLFLGENNLTGASPNQELTFLSSLTNCLLLQQVEFSLNQLNGKLPASIGNFSDAFLGFKAFGCGIKGPIPAEIGNLSNLRDLYLDSNELTGSIPTTLGSLRQLIRIYFEYNRLEGDIPGSLCQLSRLGDLYVSHNTLRGQIPTCIGEMKNLQRLYLDSNELDGNVPSNLWQLNDLVALNLSTNSLSGALSSEIGSLKAITDLDLSWNHFSGGVPSSVDRAESLVLLSLAHNKFEGAIPTSIGDLRGLESLDLSYNVFDGFIPKSLEGLAFLKYFNVSHNRLEGEIPEGGCFGNFSDGSFVGNDGLCSKTRAQQLRVPRCGSKSAVRSWIKYVIPSCLLLVLVLVVSVVLAMKRRRSGMEGRPKDDLPSLHSWGGSSYLELRRATDGFSESNILGRGGFGTVYKGTLLSGLVVAVKVFNLHSEKMAKSFVTEIEVLSSIRHRNLIKIIGCCCSGDFKALLYEYLPNGSVEQWLHSDGSGFFDLRRRLDVATDVAFALEYLHIGLENPIVHCDLKPSNVLLDGDMTARVGDFGVAKLFGEGELMAQTRTLATVGYMAPEYGAQGIVSTSGDVYSFGIMLLELCTSKRPTDDMFDEDMSLKKWVSLSLHKNTINEVVDATLLERDDKDFSSKEQCLFSLLNLAMECLASSPSNRIKISEVVIILNKIRTMFMAKIKEQANSRSSQSL